ncbi:hypothetical protein [Desulfatibacillum aliphaticivorans]|uniref:hypothetical protein n=1 Tax=Desulfatibacillum aliphaticivorans TaxID=218208 RepID=UPI0004220A8D|nr:hypothetical protein [Desulfatibacillum aliphaticivorans]
MHLQSNPAPFPGIGAFAGYLDPPKKQNLAFLPHMGDCIPAMECFYYAQRWINDPGLQGGKI